MVAYSTNDGVTGADWGSAGLTIETGQNDASYGQALAFKSSIVWAHIHTTASAGAGAISQYDFATGILTRYNVSALLDSTQHATVYSLHVHNGVLFVVGKKTGGNFWTLAKLAGSFSAVVDPLLVDGNPIGTGVQAGSFSHCAMHTDSATGNLIIVASGVNFSAQPSAAIYSIANATGGTPVETVVTPATMGVVEGADKYIAGGSSPNANRRWSVYVDSITDPTAPRTYLTTWIPGGTTETWEWKGIAAEMEAVGVLAGISDVYALPYHTAGGGHRSPSIARISIGDPLNPPVEVAGGTKIFFRGSGTAPAGTLTFRGVDNQGAPSTIVPVSAASLTLTKPLLEDSLLAYYKFNSDFLDSSGNGHGLTMTGSVPFVAGKFGNGADFPGSGATDFLNIPGDTAAFDLGLSSAPYAISCWASFDDLTLVNVITGKGTGWQMRVQADGTFESQGGATISSPAGTIVTGAALRHLVINNDGSFTKLYLDGIEVASGATVANANSVDGFIVGNRSPFVGQPYEGTLDELAIWTRALTLGEVGFLYNAGAGFELEGDTPWSAGQPSISGNTVINLTPDDSVTLYSVVLDTGATGVNIDEGETGLLIAELI